MNAKQKLTELLRHKITSRLNEMWNGPGGPGEQEPRETYIGPPRPDYWNYDPEAASEAARQLPKSTMFQDASTSEPPIRQKIAEILSTGSAEEAIKALEHPASGDETLVTAFLNPHSAVHEAALQHPTFGHPDHIEAALAAGVDETAIQKVLKAQQDRDREAHQEYLSRRYDYL